MLRISVDSLQVAAADRFLASYAGKLDDITVRTLNRTTKTVWANMRAELPRRIDRPTPWTTRGLLRRYASPTSLAVAIGFNYGDGAFSDTGFTSKGIGTPAGRYMQTQAVGGVRSQKAVERRLAGQLSLSGDRQIRPTGLGASRLDSYGNVRASTYFQLISRLRAARDIGTTSNAPRDGGSRNRSGAKRGDVDFFLRSRGGRARSIAERVGPRPAGNTGQGSGNPGRPATIRYRRGFQNAFMVTRPQRYRPRFPLRTMALAQFTQLYAANFHDSAEAAWRRSQRSR